MTDDDEDPPEIKELMKFGMENCAKCGEKIKQKVIKLKTIIKLVETHWCRTFNGEVKLQSVYKIRKRK